MITTVFVTHDQEERSRWPTVYGDVTRARRTDRDAGRVVLQASTEFVAQFVGISSRVAVERNGDSVGCSDAK